MGGKARATAWSPCHLARLATSHVRASCRAFQQKRDMVKARGKPVSLRKPDNLTCRNESQRRELLGLWIGSRSRPLFLQITTRLNWVAQTFRREKSSQK